MQRENHIESISSILSSISSAVILLGSAFCYFFFFLSSSPLLLSSHARTNHAADIVTFEAASHHGTFFLIRSSAGTVGDNIFQWWEMTSGGLQLTDINICTNYNMSSLKHRCLLCTIEMSCPSLDKCYNFIKRLLTWRLRTTFKNHKNLVDTFWATRLLQ